MTETIEQNIINYAQTVEQFTANRYVQDSAITIASPLQWRSIQNALSRMVAKGKLQRVRKGVYALSKLNVWRVVLKGSCCQSRNGSSAHGGNPVAVNNG